MVYKVDHSTHSQQMNSASSSISCFVRIIERSPLFVSISSFIILIRHVSLLGIAWYGSFCVHSSLMQKFLVFKSRWRRFFPVVDRTSVFMMARTRFSESFFPSAMLFRNLRNRLYIDLTICAVSVNGSIRYRCVRLGRSKSNLADTFHDFSSFSKSLDVKSQSGAP